MLLTQTIIEQGQEPVTIDEVKVSARIDLDITELDGQIGTLIESVRLTAEHECETLFLSRTVQLGYDSWPTDDLPVPSETTLVGVQAYDGSRWTAVEGFKLVRYLDGNIGIVFTLPDLPELTNDGSECVRVTLKIECPANIPSYIIAMVCHQLTTATAARPANPPAYLAGLLDRDRGWT